MTDVYGFYGVFYNLIILKKKERNYTFLVMLNKMCSD